MYINNQRERKEPPQKKCPSSLYRLHKRPITRWEFCSIYEMTVVISGYTKVHLLGFMMLLDNYVSHFYLPFSQYQSSMCTLTKNKNVFEERQIPVNSVFMYLEFSPSGTNYILLIQILHILNVPCVSTCC